MVCPRCRQEDSVDGQGPSPDMPEEKLWFCRACQIPFRENTLVVSPIWPDSIWVEFGSGQVVRVVDVGGDSFDPVTPIRYRSELQTEASSQTMLAQDFRFYFRNRDKGPTRATRPPCKKNEEWESLTGLLYVVLRVREDGDVFLGPQHQDHPPFWVRGRDFLRTFKRFTRRSDFDHLLDDGG